MKNKNEYLKYALVTTGREIDTNEKHFSDIASALQKITPCDAEMLKATQATLLLLFPRLDQDSIDRFTLWSIDISGTLGIDLQTAAKRLADACPWRQSRVEGPANQAK